MSLLFRLTAVMGAALFFISIAQAQFLPEDQIPLTIQTQIIEQVIAEHGFLDTVALEQAFRDWLLAQPIPNADGQMTDSGTCDPCEAPTDNEDPDFPPVRDVRIVTRTRPDGTLRNNFTVRWRRPVRLPRTIRDQYDLDHYEVYISRDDGTFEQHIIEKEMRSNGTDRLPRRIRFRSRQLGQYRISVRPIYVPIEQAGAASAVTTRGGISQATPTATATSSLTTGGVVSRMLSGGSKAGPGTEPPVVVIGPDSTVNEVFISGVIPTNSNQSLYDCIVNDPSYSSSTEIGTISTLDCADEGISNVDELEDFTSLVTLNLGNLDGSTANNNSICDISALESLGDLNSLTLSGNTSFSSTCQSSLTQMHELQYLFMDSMQLTALPGLSLTANYTTLSFADNNLGQFIAGVCPSESDTNIIPVSFFDISDNALTDADTLMLQPFEISVLNASNNQFASVEPIGCESMLRVHGLDISDNSFPNGLPGSNFDLRNIDSHGAYGHGFTFNMQSTNLTQMPRKLPNACGYVSLQGNTAVTQLVNGTNTDFPLTRPASLNFTGANTMACSSVDQMLSWNPNPSPPLPPALTICRTLEVVEPAYAGPSSCMVDQPPAGLDVDLLSAGDQYQYLASWQAAPSHWGVTHYRIEYNGTSVLVPASSGTQTNITTSPPSIGFHQFSVRSCTSTSIADCSGPSAVAEANYPLLAPQDIEVIQAANLTQVNWTYPSLPPSSPEPDYFLISPVFNVDSAPEAFTVSFSQRQHIFSDVSAYPGGAIQIAACSGNGANQVCGEQAEISVLPPPDLDISIPAPSNLSLARVNGSSHQFKLDWADSISDRVDYYLIKDSYTGREFAVEESDVDMRRFEFTANSLDFTVMACEKNREARDACSMPAHQHLQDIDPVYNLGPPANVCYFEVDPNNNPNNEYYLTWEYNGALFTPPSRFEIRGNEVSQAFIIREQDDVAFSNVEYDSGSNQWFWLSGPVRSSAHPVNGADFFELKSTLRGEHGSQSVQITPRIYNPTTGEVDWNPQGRCQTTPTIPEPLAVRTLGGPGDLNPGHWGQDPERKGNGWRLYWASELRYDDIHEAYSITYDLIAFWYTYRWMSDSQGGQWSPVWYFSRLSLNDRDTSGGNFYEGDLTYPLLNAPDENVGSVRLYFSPDNIENVPLPCEDPDPLQCELSDANQNALIEVTLNHDGGMSETFTHAINDTAISYPSIYNNAPNRHDHYSGVWTAGNLFDNDGEILTLANNNFFLVEWIEKDLHSMGLNFFDTDGQPVWAISTVCEQGAPECGETPLNYDSWQLRENDFNIVYPGNNPTGVVPNSWGEVSDHHTLVPGSAGRGYLNTNTIDDNLDLREGGFCANLGMVNFGGRSASLNTGNCTTNIPQTVPINKVASMHDIRFTIGEDEMLTQCEIGENNPSCDLLLTWFTDDYFPSVEPFFQVSSNPGVLTHLSQICNGSENQGVLGGDADFVVADFPCSVSIPGNYTFYLYSRTEVDGANGVVPKRDDNGNFLGDIISLSRTLQVDCPDNSCATNQGGVAEVPDVVPSVSNAHTLTVIGSTAHNAQIGALAGQAGVGGGAASYNVPINIPPGRQGMQPSVGLSYNSRGGNGTVGVGWSLSAGSAISRCPSTVAQDGMSKGVTYTDSDRLCLDGQRLVKTDTGNYWDINSEYRTELDNFARVTFSGNNAATSGCDVTFTVSGKDNIERHYGNGSAKVQPVDVTDNAQDCVTNSWLLQREQDSPGNTVNYTYANYGDGETLLTQINYTGFAGDIGNRKVVFSYQNRDGADRANSYLRGYRSEQTQRLNFIETFVGQQRVRHYQLTYGLSDASSRTLLTEISESATDSSNQLISLPSTVFEWQSETLTFERELLPDQTQEPQGLSALRANRAQPELPLPYVVNYIPLADLNGDGATDFYIRATVPSGVLEMLEADESDFPPINSISTLNAEGELMQSFDIGNCPDISFLIEHGTFADVNGDGISDIGAVSTNASGELVFSMYAWDRSSNANPDNDCMLVAISGTQLAVDHELDTYSTGDFNNDGLIDFFDGNYLGDVSQMIEYRIIWNTGTLRNPQFDLTAAGMTVIDTLPFVASPFTVSIIPSIQQRDFNGDGLTDFLIEEGQRFSNHNASDYHVYLNTQQMNGTSVIQTFEETALFSSRWNFDYSDESFDQFLQFWIDINGDGLEDFIHVRDIDDDDVRTWYYKLNLGNVFSDSIDTGQTLGGVGFCEDSTGNLCDDDRQVDFSDSFQIADINNNGIPELLLPDIDSNNNPDYAFIFCQYHHLDADPTTITGDEVFGFICSENTESPQTFDDISRQSLNRGILRGDAYEFRLDPVSSEFRLVTMPVNGQEPVLLQRRNNRAIPVVFDAFGDGLSDIGLSLQATFNKQAAADWVADNQGDNLRQVLANYFVDADTLQDVTQGLFVQRNAGATSDANARHMSPDLMTKATDGFLNQAAWNYQPLSAKPERLETTVPLYMIPDREMGDGYLQFGDGDHIYFASTMYVVSQFEQSNGLDCIDTLGTASCNGDWIDLANTTYYGYEEAVFNTLGRGFQGFRKIISEQHVTGPQDNPDNNLRSIAWFNQIFPLAGTLEASYTQLTNQAYYFLQDRDDENGNPDLFDPTVPHLKMTVNTWGCQRESLSVLNNCGIGTSGDPVFNATGLYQPILTNSIESNRELDQTSADYSSTTSASTYDNYGNLLAQTQTVSNQSLLTHTTTITNIYAAPDLNDWWLNRMQSSMTEVISDYGNAHSPEGGGIGQSEALRTSTNLFGYTGNGISFRRPTCQQIVDGNAATQSCGNVTTGVWQQTNTTYGDSYGNPTHIVVDANQNDGSIVDRSTTTTYSEDTDVGYFPKTITNALGHMVTTTIETREGNPTMVMDANNLVTQMRYDVFGREVETWHPIAGAGMTDVGNHYAPRSRTVYADVGAGICPLVPDHADYCMASISDGAPMVRQYMDSLGRVVQTTSNGFLQNNSNQQSVIVSSQYNGRGQMILETVPRYDSISLDVTTYQYDALGRITRKSQPSSSSTSFTMYSHYLYAGLTTEVQVSNLDTPLPSGSCSMANNAALNNDLCMRRTYASNGWLLSTTDAHGSIMDYWYDGQGNPVLIEDPENNQTMATYNNVGHRITLNDPNMGVWSYSYNGLGEVLTQTDANAQVMVFAYDQLGRLTNRSSDTADTELGGISDSWDYDDIGQNGLLISETRTMGLQDTNSAPFTAETYRKVYAYDDYQRPSGYTVTLNPYSYGAQGNTPIYNQQPVYTMGMEYDNYFSRVKAVTYPQERLREYTTYEINGFVRQQGDSRDYDASSPSNSAYWRRVESMTPVGQVVMESFANGASDQMYTHNQRTYQMEGTQIGISGNDHMRAYGYDLYGNITEQTRTLGSSIVTENFGYDHLHRMTSSNRTFNNVVGTPTSYHFDRLGNIEDKQDYGDNYGYLNQSFMSCTGRPSNANPGPNAVRSVDLNNSILTARYGYDSNGNLICGQDTNVAGDELAINYDHTNKPFRINRGSNTAEFWYGSDDQRYLQQDNANGDNTLYIGKGYEQKGNTQKLYLGNYAVFTIDPQPGQTGMTYLHKDRLGSVIVMSDEAGHELTETSRGFDPFGKPREGDWGDTNGIDNGPNGLLGDLDGYEKTTRGYTGHEHLNGTDLIHMNGRAYDYNLGRFLSVDPFIQSPGNSQGMNAYSYIMNSPLAGTDPSGYMSLDAGGGTGLPETVNLANTPIDQLESLSVNTDGSVSVTLKNGGTYSVDGVSASTSSSGGVTSVSFSNGGGGAGSTISAGGMNTEAIGGQSENSAVDEQVVSFNSESDEVTKESSESDYGLNLTEDEYLEAVKKGLWKDAPVYDGFSNNEEVKESRARTNAKAENFSGDIVAGEDYIKFVRNIAKATAKARIRLPNRTQNGEKFIVLTTNSDGQIVVRDIGVQVGQGGDIFIRKTDTAIVHVHYKGLVQRPDGSDHSPVKAGRHSFVLGAKGGISWEVGRVDGDYFYREIQRRKPGRWKVFRGAK